MTSVHQEEGRVNSLSLWYSLVVEAAGGIPLVIPTLENIENIKEILSFFDGIILSGGGDPDPFIFGEEPVFGQGKIEPPRDYLELILAEEALNLNLPILGICRGMQMINLAAGGSIYQDIGLRKKKNIKHMQDAPRWYPTHKVYITPHSRLASIFDQESHRVNSFHHQGINKLGKGLISCAYASDGLVEALEGTGENLVMGVQWHPETMWVRDSKMLDLFKYFIKETE
ncbi:gamma-glutamyl-gamma-aminobutyrate hydrolase family protein [Candidatus Contubernalis alkalaceticus]|uniref:gamma-glutamyl-gamma-aminobutyrate hydrolase family protein n=1 Tax=Candidatus Contubernalis alkaliaceticus TaxID=338645 RepID=UPI00387E2DB0